MHRFERVHCGEIVSCSATSPHVRPKACSMSADFLIAIGSRSLRPRATEFEIEVECQKRTFVLRPLSRDALTCAQFVQLPSLHRLKVSQRCGLQSVAGSVAIFCCKWGRSWLHSACRQCRLYLIWSVSGFRVCKYILGVTPPPNGALVR